MLHVSFDFKKCKTTTKIMIWLLLILSRPGEGQAQTVVGRRPCADSLDLSASYDRTLRPRNQYTLTYLGITEIQANSQMILRFDSEVTLKFLYPRTARISKLSEDSSHSYEFTVMFTDKTSFFRVQVLGPASGYSIPYVQSVVLNNEELCNEPKTGYLYYATERPKVATGEVHIDEEPAAVVKGAIKYTKTIEDIKTTEDTRTIKDTKKNSRNLDESCGRRKVAQTPLIVHGQPTQPGDWPWHAAILNFDGLSLKFRCGGTLLSKTLILTAAHCATDNGSPIIPYSLSIVLGKYKLIGGDIGAQERGVFQVIVHSAFDGKTLNNDIALLRLNTEAVLDEYVQPACLWHPALPNEEELYGTVVGWGFNHQDKLSLTLQQITIPIVSELTCLKSDPLFFHRRLNNNKFCAGFANGTSVCNGDSGGGLMIFVPGDTDTASGAWYVRGIVSFAARRTDAAICDPYVYTIFTDVAMYRDWVLEYLN